MPIRLTRQIRLKRPDAAVIDIRMPPTHTDEGLIAARSIRDGYPEIGLLILSQYVEPHYAMQLLEHHPEGDWISPQGAGLRPGHPSWIHLRRAHRG